MRGRDKLLEEVRGQPLLRDRAKTFITAGLHPVLVVLPPDRPDREGAIDSLEVRKIINPLAHTGMASSIKAGLTALPTEPIGALLMPADMPNITATHLSQLKMAFESNPKAIIRSAGLSGSPSSPNLIPRELFGYFDALEGDQGGRDIFKQCGDRIYVTELDGQDATIDLDTPEDWENWRKSNRNLT